MTVFLGMMFELELKAGPEMIYEDNSKNKERVLILAMFWKFYQVKSIYGFGEVLFIVIECINQNQGNTLFSVSAILEKSQNIFLKVDW